MPVVVWNAQLVDEFAEDADFDLIMVNSGMAGLPELTSSLIRAGRDFHLVTGTIDDERTMDRLGRVLRAAKAAARLRNARIGIIGHPYEGMTDLMQDNFAVMETLGATCWPIQPDEVTDAFLAASEKDAGRLVEEERAKGRKIEVEAPLMLRSARLALALERVVEAGGYDAVAEFDQAWLADERVGVIPFYGTSRMVERHVPFTCEADVLRAAAMLVLEELAGHATFLEHYILDHRRDRVFESHDGHGNPALADARHGVRIVPTIYYQGVHGFGASFNYSYKPGGGHAAVDRQRGRGQVPADRLPRNVRADAAPGHRRAPGLLPLEGGQRRRLQRALAAGRALAPPRGGLRRRRRRGRDGGPDDGNRLRRGVRRQRHSGICRDLTARRGRAIIEGVTRAGPCYTI